MLNLEAPIEEIDKRNFRWENPKKVQKTQPQLSQDSATKIIWEKDAEYREFLQQFDLKRDHEGKWEATIGHTQEKIPQPIRQEVTISSINFTPVAIYTNQENQQIAIMLPNEYIAQQVNRPMKEWPRHERRPVI